MDKINFKILNRENVLYYKKEDIIYEKRDSKL